MTAEAIVADITETDIPDVAAFLARQARPGEAAPRRPLPPVERLRWLLLENPARGKGIPRGWCIRNSSHAVVGAAICVPFRIGARGQSFTALMFCKFFVDADYRGMGLGLLMRYVREAQRFPLFVTSTNEVAGQLFARVGASLVGGMDHTMLGIASPRPVAEEWLYRKLGRTSIARLLSMPAGLARRWTGRRSRSDQGSGLTDLRNADEVVALNLPAPDHALAVIRDRDYLHWRYFTGEMDRHVHCFRFPEEPDRMVVVNAVQSGYRGQIRVLNVLDLWPPTTAASAPALAGSLANRYRGEFDTIWLRSQPQAAEAALREAGFIRHAFPAPLGWYIDREQKLPARDWYLMPGESE